MHQWLSRLAETVDRLAVEQLSPINLANDEGFLDLLDQATQVAVSTRLEEKRSALASVVVKAAASAQPDRDKEQLFVRLIEELTPTHLSVLSFLHTHPDDVKDITSYEDLRNVVNADTVARHGMPIDAEFFRQICLDMSSQALAQFSVNLQERSWVRESEIVVTGAESNDSLPMVAIRPLGESLLTHLSLGGL